MQNGKPHKFHIALEPGKEAAFAAVIDTPSNYWLVKCFRSDYSGYPTRVVDGPEMARLMKAWRDMKAAEVRRKNLDS